MVHAHPRHEAGHAIDNAFRCAAAGSGSTRSDRPAKPYPEFYTPKPYSKSFVLHLDSWYAQSHPDEDFAETFAVWLTPNSEWRQRYAGWRALGKLEYMDALMDSLRGRGAAGQNPEEVDPLSGLRTTLRQHYRNKRRYYGVDYPNFYDRDLRRLFSDAPEFADAHDRRAVHQSHPALGQTRRLGLDRHLPVHDRSGARGHDRALPRAEAAARRARGPGATGVHGAADRAGDELPAQRRHRLFCEAPLP